MDQDKLGVTFLLWYPNVNIAYRVHAPRPEGGPVHVEKTKFFSPAQ